MLGIGGACTFAKAEELHEVVRRTPLDFLVLETDAPYMAPVPHRGKRNEPAHLPLVVNRIAELKEVAREEVAAATTRNARRLFRLD
jgi:TatD DNase family protein